MRQFILATATIGIALFTTAASAAVVLTRAPTTTPSRPSPAIITSCSGELGSLMSVHKDDVIDVGPENTVVIRPVCTDSHLDGNATGLRGIIARNEVMAIALAAENFAADDVVGIRFGADGLVLLYVMQ